MSKRMECNQEAKRLYRKGVPIPKIAKKFGVNEYTIRNWGKREGWFESRTYPEKERLELSKRAHKLRKEGYDYREVAEKLSVQDRSGNTIIRWARKDGWYEAERVDRTEDRKSARRKSKRGWSLIEIARHFDVTYPTIIHWAKQDGWYDPTMTGSRGVKLRKLKEAGISETKYIGYRRHARSYTERVYTRYRSLINPKGLKRTQDGWHLDHCYSLFDGLRKGLPIETVCHPANLVFVKAEDNHSKNYRSHCTRKELAERIRKWEKKHGKVSLD